MRSDPKQAPTPAQRLAIMLAIATIISIPVSAALAQER
jgi:hypothetical protein